MAFVPLTTYIFPLGTVAHVLLDKNNGEDNRQACQREGLLPFIQNRYQPRAEV